MARHPTLSGPERATPSESEVGTIHGRPPHPALVEVVHFLARRAARQWFEQQMRDRGGEDADSALREILKR